MTASRLHNSFGKAFEAVVFEHLVGPELLDLDFFRGALVASGVKIADVTLVAHLGLEWWGVLLELRKIDALHPGVHHDLAVGEPVLRLCEQLRNKLFAELRHLRLRWKLQKLMVVQNLLARLARVVRGERRPAEDHLEQDRADAPEVHRLRVSLRPLADDLHRGVVRRADGAEGLEPRVLVRGL